MNQFFHSNWVIGSKFLMVALCVLLFLNVANIKLLKKAYAADRVTDGSNIREPGKGTTAQLGEFFGKVVSSIKILKENIQTFFEELFKEHHHCENCEKPYY